MVPTPPPSVDTHDLMSGTKLKITNSAFVNVHFSIGISRNLIAIQKKKPCKIFLQDVYHVSLFLALIADIVINKKFLRFNCLLLYACRCGFDS